MKQKMHTFECFLLILLLFISINYADNPIVQTSFTADPAPLVYNDTLFLYTGDDSLCEATNTGFFMRYWKCYSTTDMTNWTYRAIILPTSTVKWAGGDANAAQCVYRNGKFYFYFTSTHQGSQAVGVSVADNPLGPFIDIGKPLITADLMNGCNATHGWRGLDPTVYIDDDEQAYLYWGNNVCYWVILNNDMVSYSGPITCMAQNNPAFGPDFEEAPWIFKRNSKWYLLYASRLPENIGYTMSNSPTGPWSFGSIISNAPSAQNGNHPGYIEYKGNSYLFSFMDKNSSLPNATNFRRAVCVEQFTFNADGTIPTIVFSKTGPSQISHLNPYDTTQAETVCWSAGLKAEACSEGGMNIDSIHHGDYIKVKGVDFGMDGAKSFDARVASGNDGGSIEIHLDSITGSLAGNCNVRGTGGWQSWRTESCNVSRITGVHDLYFKFTGGNDLLFKFNWWKFIPITTTEINGALVNEGKNGSLVTIKANDFVTGKLHLLFSSKVVGKRIKVRLFDASGRLGAELFDDRLSGQILTFQLNRTGTPKGTCILRLESDNIILFTKTIVM